MAMGLSGTGTDQPVDPDAQEFDQTGRWCILEQDDQ